MKILVINDVATGGGAERVMLDLLLALCRLGERPTVLCTNCSRREMRDAFPRRVSTVSLEPLISGRRPNRLIRVINKLWRFCKLIPLRMRKWDVILAFKEGETMILASSLNAKKKIGWIHVDYRFLYWTKTVFGTPAAELALLQQFDSIVCVSNSAADSVRAVIGDPGNLCVRYNPLHVKRIQEKAAQPVEIPDHKVPLFVTVGRLVEQKNYKMLVHCCAELLREFDFELWIIGEGPQRDELQELIDSSEGGRNIKLLGRKENPYPFIKQADYFVSSCVWESYGLAIQEALILGVPVISTRCPALDEVCDKRFAILCENSQHDLMSALRSVLAQPEIRKQFHRNIMQFYPDHQTLYHNRIGHIMQLWKQKYE